MKTLGDKGELALIDYFRKLYSSRKDVVCGIGDDCAVVRSASDSSFDWVLTSDAVIEAVHFDSSASPRSVGHKAVARTLSDLAAMGAEPKWALMNLVAPDSTPLASIEAMCEQAAATAAKHGLAIVGGDTTEGRAIEIHVFAVGCVPTGTALLRSGASPADDIYVTGDLGLSLAGKHLSFAPRLKEGAWLRANVRATAMIDISDGLLIDLGRIARMSKAGATVNVDSIPVSNAARAAADGRTPIEHALHDGEDYELLFTVPRVKTVEFESAWNAVFTLPATRIGSITDRVGKVCCVDAKGAPVRVRNGGYEHFKRRSKD